MKLSKKGLGGAMAVVWGGGFFLAALANLFSPAYGRAFLELCGSVYPGYHVTRTPGSVVIGTLYALLDGAVCGVLFAWIYNRITCCCCPETPEEASKP